MNFKKWIYLEKDFSRPFVDPYYVTRRNIPYTKDPTADSPRVVDLALGGLAQGISGAFQRTLDKSGYKLPTTIGRGLIWPEPTAQENDDKVIGSIEYQIQTKDKDGKPLDRQEVRKYRAKKTKEAFEKIHKHMKDKGYFEKGIIDPRFSDHDESYNKYNNILTVSVIYPRQDLQPDFKAKYGKREPKPLRLNAKPINKHWDKTKTPHGHDPHKRK